MVMEEEDKGVQRCLEEEEEEQAEKGVVRGSTAASSSSMEGAGRAEALASPGRCYTVTTTADID